MSEYDDFDDNGDLNPNRKRRKFTKDDALYGVFNDAEPEFIDNPKTAKKYSKPMAFVSTGPTVVSSTTDVDGNELGGNKSTFAAWQEVNMPKSFGKTKQRQEKPKPSASETERLRKPDTKFEKFTKGFGSRMMEKMGYKGGGMAPIEVKVRPVRMGIGFGNFVERAVGQDEFYGDKDEEEDDGHNDTTRNAAAAIAREERDRDGWKKGKKKLQHQQYLKALDEESRKAAMEATAKSATGIIDMRGPEAKLLGSISEASVGSGGSTRKQMPKLYYNVRLLVDVVRVELLELDNKEAQRQRQLKALEEEELRVADQLQRENEQIEKVEKLQSLISEASDRVRNNEISVSQLTTLLQGLQTTFSREFEVFRLSRLVCALILPVLKKQFHAWSPLVDPNIDQALAESMISLRNVLLKRHAKNLPGYESDDEDNADRVDDDVALLTANASARYDVAVYHKLIDELVLPSIRLGLMRRWEATDASSAVTLLASWRHALPVQVYATLLEQLVLPKLTRAIESSSDVLHAHEWLLPWQHLVGNGGLDALFDAVRRKLQPTLKKLAGSDPLLRSTMDAWKLIFDEKTMRSFVENSVMPSLERLLHTTPIDPTAPDISALQTVMSWCTFEYITVDNVVHLLESAFFPQWFKVTLHWLNGTPDFGELADWYQGWKELFPNELVSASGRLRVMFNHALDMMKCRKIGIDIPAPPAPTSQARIRAHRAEMAAKLGIDHPPVQTNTHSKAGVSDFVGGSSLREAISELASEHGVAFSRAPRLYDGRVAYLLGHAVVRFEEGLLLHRQATGEWKPASVDQLLQENAPQ